jgi:hypothetical protein
MLRFSIASCLGAFGLLLAAAAFAEQVEIRPLTGAMIVTRTTPADATLMWDATRYVTVLVNDKLTDERGMRAIEATALRALAEKGKTLTASSLTLKVTYARTGAVSPLYRSVTFAGFEPVMTIAAKNADLAKHAGAWSEQLASGVVPTGVTVSITGKLPPAE